MNAFVDKSRLNIPAPISRPTINPDKGPGKGPWQPGDSPASPAKSTARTATGHLADMPSRQSSLSKTQASKAHKHKAAEPATSKKEVFDKDAFLAKQMVSDTAAQTAQAPAEEHAKLDDHAELEGHPQAEEHTEADKPHKSIGTKVLDVASAINPVIGRVRTKVNEAGANGENRLKAGVMEYGKTIVDMGVGAFSAVTTVASSGIGLTAEANPIGLVAVAATGAYLKASGKNEYAPDIVKTASKIV